MALIQLIKRAETEFDHRGLVTELKKGLHSEVSNWISGYRRDIDLLFKKPGIVVSETKHLANEA